MHLSKVNEALQHKITGGIEFQWDCWPNTRFLDYESNGAFASIIFNIATQEVYNAEINSNAEGIKPYRWMNPAYKQSYIDEAKVRNIDYTVAWDDVKWTELETSEDWCEKASAIFKGESFDERIQVPLNLSKDELFQLMSLAHERDVTLNEMVTIVLEDAIGKALNE